MTECFYSYQLCHLIKHGGLSERMYARVPFVVHEDEWISYDNPSSVQEKVIFSRNHIMDALFGAIGQKGKISLRVQHMLHNHHRVRFRQKMRTPERIQNSYKSRETENNEATRGKNSNP